MSTRLCLLAALSLLLCSGCARSRPATTPGEGISDVVRLGPAQLTPSAIQSETMSYADTFISAVSQIWTAISTNARKAIAVAPDDASGAQEVARQNSIRRASLEVKLANVNAALLIASSPNPLVALSDMATLVTLQRMVLETPGTKKLFGAEIQGQLVEVYKEQEINIWQVCSQAMTPDQIEQLKGLIQTWRDDHPDATYVSSVRLDDFSAARQISVNPSSQKDESLLSALSIDPLAGLDPAQREVTKTRMLAERIFFYSSRVPSVVKWQVESLYMGLMQAPEVVDVLRSARNASDAAQDLSKFAQGLPEQLTKERQALIRQIFDDLSKERSATIEQINQALSAQRLAALDDLQSAQGKFQNTLKDFRETAASANTLADKLTTTLKAADTLAARFAPTTPTTPTATPLTTPATTAPAGKEPDSLQEFRSAVDRTADAAERLTQLTKSIDQLLASPALTSKNGSLQTVVQEVQFSGRELVNYAFWRLLIVVIVAPFAVVAAMGLYKKVVARA
ncbi:MAG: hypothetical protein U0573_13530 [Phycisphaerales bacterium]|nr:hypothetical protein [Planctomycetota bacterium]